MGSIFVCRCLISCRADRAVGLFIGCPFLGLLLYSGLGHLAAGVGVEGTAEILQANRRGCLGVSAMVSVKTAGVGFVEVDSSWSGSWDVDSCYLVILSARCARVVIGVGGLSLRSYIKVSNSLEKYQMPITAALCP